MAAAAATACRRASPVLHRFRIFFLAVPGIACAIFWGGGQAGGIPTLVLNVFICIMALGFMCSKRYGLDRVAAKHVALSFRFAIFVTLLATIVALNIREAYTIDTHPAYVAAYTFAALFLCLCTLLDCSPHVPPLVQIYISVRARTNAMLRMREFAC